VLAAALPEHRMPNTDSAPPRPSFAALQQAIAAKRAHLTVLVGDGSGERAFVARRERHAPHAIDGVYVLSRDLLERGAWRLTHFTLDGPAGHMVYLTLNAVVAALMGTPAETAPGVVDGWSMTDRWREGMAIAARTRQD
jgi:hypothetical protein